MKYLIAGLGNIGNEYVNTRHNIGFLVLDALAETSNTYFKEDRLAFTAEVKYKARTFILIKPTTYMNLSGKAINYWLQTSKIPLNNLLVITDDIALPFGTLRLKASGSDGGHNGLKSIAEILGSINYPRLRFGIGNNFSKGQQVNYVLSEWSEDEKKKLHTNIELAVEIINKFGTIGIQRTMNEYNSR